MVVIFLPATAPVVVTQERTGEPSTSTVQAPQTATPQPNFVPVRLSFSRMAQRRGMSGGASTCRLFPFTVSVIMSPPSS